MPDCPVTILGGLPVIAEVWFSGPDYYGEYNAGVDGIYWQKRNGLKGKLISKKIHDRLDKIDYWQSDVLDQANDYLAYRDEDENSKVTLI